MIKAAYSAVKFWAPILTLDEVFMLWNTYLYNTQALAKKYPNREFRTKSFGEFCDYCRRAGTRIL